MTSTPSRIVSIEWLAAHIDSPDIVVVDVRPEDQYNSAHIPGARSLDLNPHKVLDSDPAAIDRWVEAMQEALRDVGIRHGDHPVFY